MLAQTNYFKQTDELKDSEGRRTSFVVRFSLSEAHAMFDIFKKIKKPTPEQRWAMERFTKEALALMEERGDE
jgi:hypothetical protein